MTDPKRHNRPARILGLYRTMCVIRAFEERAEAAFDEGLVVGSVHQYIGEEAIGTGVCANLRTSDYILSNHRGHGHSIAKGADPTAMMKELMGRVGGTSGGKGGSMHIADFSVGMLGANGVLADGLTMGVGYASSTITKTITAGDGPVARAEAFGMPAFDIDGNDVVAVDELAADLVSRVRGGGGPHFLHARTYRVKGHISRDKMLYRAEGETGIGEDEVAATRASAYQQIDDAVVAAKGAPFPDAMLAYADVQDFGAPDRWSY